MERLLEGSERAATGPGRDDLIVEDEDAVRRLGVRVLTEAGYTVLEAGSGQHALRICRT
jgi:CheY-like chemotaxis protein